MRKLINAGMLVLFMLVMTLTVNAQISFNTSTGVIGVEKYEIVMGAAVISTSFNLRNNQTITNSVPFATMRLSGNGDEFDSNMVDVSFADGPDRIVVSRIAGIGIMDIIVTVVQFDSSSVIVQNGTFAMIGSTSITVPLDIPVNLSSSALIFNNKVTGFDNDYDMALVRGRINATDNLIFNRADPLGDSTGTWFLFESINQSFTVQNVSLSLIGTGQTDESMTTPINTSKTFLISSHTTTHPVNDVEKSGLMVELVNSTHIVGTKSLGGSPVSDIVANVFAITFLHSEEVIRGTMNFPGGTSSQTDSFEAINASTSMAWGVVQYGLMEGNNTASAGVPSGFRTLNITNTTHIIGERSNNVGDTRGQWEIIQWAIIAPDITNPLVNALIPIAGFNTSSQSIEVAANVTDDTTVDTVFANITFPNGSFEVITLTNVIGDKFNGTFIIPEILGRYNISYFANDTSSNVNDSETSFFNVTIFGSKLRLFSIPSSVQIFQSFLVLGNYTSLSTGLPILNATCTGEGAPETWVTDVGAISTNKAIHTGVLSIAGNVTQRIDISGIPANNTNYHTVMRIHANNVSLDDDLRIYARCDDNATIDSSFLIGTINSSNAVLGTSGDPSTWKVYLFNISNSTVTSDTCIIMAESQNLGGGGSWAIADVNTSLEINNSFSSTDFGGVWTPRVGVTSFVDMGYSIVDVASITLDFNVTSGLYQFINHRSITGNFSGNLTCTRSGFENQTDTVSISVTDNQAPTVQINLVSPNFSEPFQFDITIEWVATDLELVEGYLNVSLPNGTLLQQFFSSPAIVDSSLLGTQGIYNLTAFGSDATGLTSFAFDSFNVSIIPLIIRLSSCIISPIPIIGIGRTIPVVCNLSVTVERECIVYTSRGGTIISTSPDIQEIEAIGLIPTFRTNNGLLHGYYSQFLLQPEVSFNVTVACGDINVTKEIIPQHKGLVEVTGAYFWAFDNAPFLIGIALFGSLMLGIAVIIIKKVKG